MAARPATTGATRKMMAAVPDGVRQSTGWKTMGDGGIAIGNKEVASSKYSGNGQRGMVQLVSYEEERVSRWSTSLEEAPRPQKRARMVMVMVDSGEKKGAASSECCSAKASD